MSKEELIEKLGRLKGKYESSDPILVSKVEHILDIVKKEYISFDDIDKLGSVKAFMKKEDTNESLIYVPDRDYVEKMLDDIKKIPAQKKDDAMCNMRAGRKKSIIAMIVVLVSLALVALILGILSTLAIIGEIYSNLIGNLDCVLGILFFAYELYDDKLKSSKIQAGDESIISKYTINNGIMAGRDIKVDGDVQQAFDAIASVVETINTGNNKNTENETNEAQDNNDSILEQIMKKADNVEYYKNSGIDAGRDIKIKTEVKKKK